MKIAIIKIGALGDVVRTTCVLKPLHKNYVKPEIWWYTAASAVPLLERNPFISRIVPIEGIEGLKQPAFDLVINLDEDLRAATLASRLSPKIVGVYLDSSGKPGYTADTAPWFSMGLLNRDANGKLETANALKKANKNTYPEIILRMLALYDGLKDWEYLIYPDPKEETWAAAFFAEHDLKNKMVVGFNTGSGSRWLTKQMTVEKTVELMKEIHASHSGPMLLLGGPEEVERNKILLKTSGVPLIDTGTANSLPRFISLVNLCDVLITSDSLALHIATALKKQVVVFFGSTSSDEIPIYGKGLKWLPETKCSCFYAAACTAPGFCLDTLNCGRVAKFVNGS